MNFKKLISLFRKTPIGGEREALGGLRARDAMRPLPVVKDGASLKEVLQRMLEARTTVLPVGSETIPCGLIAAEDLKRADPSHWRQLRLVEFAHRCDAAADLNEPLEETYAKVLRIPLQVIPVTEGGKILGIVLLRELEEMIELRTLLMREPPSSTDLPTSAAATS